MKPKRNESFRYTFEEPIPALFEIIEFDARVVSTSKGEAKITNLSPHGIKLNSHLKIPKKVHKTIHLSISFELNNKKLNASGEVVWMKDNGKSVDYGIDLNIDEATEKEIIEQLKIYSKKTRSVNE